MSLAFVMVRQKENLYPYKMEDNGMPNHVEKISSERGGRMAISFRQYILGFILITSLSLNGCIMMPFMLKHMADRHTKSKTPPEIVHSTEVSKQVGMRIITAVNAVVLVLLLLATRYASLETARHKYCCYA